MGKKCALGVAKWFEKGFTVSLYCCPIDKEMETSGSWWLTGKISSWVNVISSAVLTSSHRFYVFPGKVF